MDRKTGLTPPSLVRILITHPNRPRHAAPVGSSHQEESPMPVNFSQLTNGAARRGAAHPRA
ncbi:MAG: hypothetical protein K2W96_03200 [Gemmataceae bacterium]|nr:hypothetical protein [Gemmataceae bacterium]